MTGKPTTGPAQLADQARARLARTINVGPDFGGPLERNWTVGLQRGHLEACARNGFTLPEDERNLSGGIHHYWPITFTMQGSCGWHRSRLRQPPATG